MSVNEPCPGKPGRFAISPAVTAEIDIIYHPDRPNEPGTGAVESMCVDLDDWHKLPAMKIAIVGIVEAQAEFPFLYDQLYGDMYGPYWLRAGIEVCTAAFMMSLLDEERIKGVLRYLATEHELQQSVSAAHRLGVPPIECYMIIHERLED